MVFGGKKNLCLECNEELLGRDEVEAIVDGRERVMLPRECMQWHTYMCGNAFMYAEFGGQTGSRGVTKNIVCGCTYKKADTSSMTMIRSEYRDHIRELFGDELSVPLLFSIPAAMVAWENSGMVKARSSEHGMIIGDEGMSLIDIVADMSRIGLFDGSVQRFGSDDVMQGFTYLHMIRPRYRSFVAMDYGSTASFASLFAHVPLDWFDWQQMLTLKCVPGTVAGEYSVTRVPGVPLVQHVTSVLSDMKPICHGSAVTRNNTCVQFMSDVEYGEGTLDWIGSGCAYDVLLFEGQTFLPAGRVLLQGREKAITFEPGVKVRSRRGTLITAPNGAVTVFLNGRVEVELRPGDVKQWQYALDPVGPGTSFRMYQVAATCESYAHGTRLHNWYCKRLDVLSTSARFYQGSAELLLLHHSKVDTSGASELILGGGTLPNEVGVGTKMLELDGVKTGYKFWLKQVEFILSVSMTLDVPVSVVVNGVLECRDSVPVGMLSDAIITFSTNAEYRDIGREGADWPFTLNVKCAIPLDSYVVDCGGPSDSDGGFHDETGTHVSSKSMDVLVCRAAQWREDLAFQMVPVESDFWSIDTSGFGYLRLAKHKPTLAHHLGIRPQMHDLMCTPCAYIDVGVLLCSGWLRTINGWELVDDGHYHMTWRDLARIAITWYSVARQSTILCAHLFRLFELDKDAMDLSRMDHID